MLIKIEYEINYYSHYGTPPASKKVIDQLFLKKITKDITLTADIQECSVCKEEFKIDEEVREMPCNHLFHQDCLIPWLNQVLKCFNLYINLEYSIILVLLAVLSYQQMI